MAEDEQRRRSSDLGNTPNPDPTLLTTQQLIREMAALANIFDAKMSGIDAKLDGQGRLLEARLDGMDTAVKLLQVVFDRIPSLIDSKVANLEQLHEEKFRSIQVQFSERDVRTESTQRDSKVAVDAALQAAKEAVGEQNRSAALAIAKSESATAKQIDQQGLLIASQGAATDDKIGDIKERLTRIEGAALGAVTANVANQVSHTNTQASSSWVLALVMGGFGILGILVAVVTELSRAAVSP